MVSQKIPYFRQINAPLKNASIIIFLTLSTIVSAKNYYVKSTGKDSNTGLSDAQAWQTIAKVNGASLIAGDSVLFNRGDTWREQIAPKAGSAVNYLYYGAYGTGAKPLFLGSKQENSTSDWVNVGTNIWQNSDAAFIVDVGNIVFNNESSCGVKLMTATPTFTAQGQFWYDFLKHRIRMYSIGNPASVYTNIECALKNNALYMYGKTYVLFQNLDFRYWGSHVWEYGGNYIKFYDIDLSYIGGSDQYGDYTVRYGNGFQVWENCHDITIESCKVDNVYDGGIGIAGWRMSYNLYNIYMRNNIVSNCEYNYSVELFETGGTATVHNIYFENNTCINAGGGWGHNQRPDGPNACHVLINWFIANRSDIYIRNNIFYNSTNYITKISKLSDVAGTNLDYNDYYQSSGIIGRIVDKNDNYYTLATWKTAISQEAHSIDSNPSFVSKTDFHLQTDSRAIDAGIDIGFPYNGPAPDIGAFEIQPIKGVDIPVNTSSVVENATPKIIEMTYNVSLANIIPSVNTLTVQVNGVYRNVYSVAISGNRVELTLATAVVFGDKVTVSYTKPNSNWLQTNSGDEAASITYQPVTNKCLETTKPGLVDTKERKIIIYPNPASNFINISIGDLTSIPQIIKIIDLSGKIVFTEYILQGIKNVQIIENLNTGIYIILLISNNLILYSQKLIINK